MNLTALCAGRAWPVSRSALLLALLAAVSIFGCTPPDGVERGTPEVLGETTDALEREAALIERFGQECEEIEFDFRNVLAAGFWQARGGTLESRLNEGLIEFKPTALNDHIASMNLSLVSHAPHTVEITMSVDKGRNARLTWLNKGNNALALQQQYAFEIIPDGQMHTYSFRPEESTARTNEGWYHLSGPAAVIKQLMLYPTDEPGATVRISSIRIYLPYDIGLTAFSSRSNWYVGQTFGFQTQASNMFSEPMMLATSTLTARGDITIHGNNRITFQKVPPGGDMTVPWLLTLNSDGLQELRFEFGTKSRNRSFTLPLCGLPAFELTRFNDAGIQVKRDGDSIFISNGSYTLGLISGEAGYGHIVVNDRPFVSMAEQQTYTRALMEIEVTEGGKEKTLLVMGENARVIEQNQQRAVIEVQLKNSPRVGTRFNGSLKITLERDAPHATFDYDFTVSRAADLLGFTAPRLYSSFDEYRGVSIFPGLTYLDDINIGSSNRKSTVAQYAKRDFPDPRRVTWPAMFIINEDELWDEPGDAIGLTWEPGARIGAQQLLINPVYSTRDQVSGNLDDVTIALNQHIMGLAFPPVPQHRREYSLGEIGERYKYGGNEHFELSCDVVVIPSPTQYEALEHFARAASFSPVHQTETTSLDIAKPYLDEYYDGEDGGWVHAVWRDRKLHSSDPLLAVALMRTAETMEDGSEKTRLLSICETMIEKSLQNNHGSPDGYFFTGLYTGNMDRVREQALENCSSTIWRGMVNNETDVQRLRALKNHGSTTGFAFLRSSDRARARLGMGRTYFLKTQMPRSLADTNVRNVPRGAQAWELPLAAPDLYAAALGVKANVAMKKLADPSNKFIEDPIAEARQWALTGLPFVYSWSDGESVVPYTTIPAFGASWFFQPWFGRPVQWVGLEYAEALLELAEYDNTLPWGQIARGIHYASLEMLNEDGSLPDIYDSTTGETEDPRLAPITPLLVQLRLEGRPVEPHVELIDNDMFSLGLSTYAKPRNDTEIAIDGLDGSIVSELTPIAANEYTYFLLAGKDLLRFKEWRLTLDGEKVEQVEKLDGTEGAACTWTETPRWDSDYTVRELLVRLPAGSEGRLKLDFTMHDNEAWAEIEAQEDQAMRQRYAEAQEARREALSGQQ